MVILRWRPGALSWVAFAWTFPSLVLAGIVNRTIDDTFGDSQTGLRVTYLPVGSIWKDQTCGDCSINPDVANAFEGTYTAATYTPDLGSINMTMQFNGTAIYIFFILVNNGDASMTLTNFTLDGNEPQLFVHAPALTAPYLEFNQLVFTQTNLINAQHTLVISTSGVDISNVYVNFDYAIYTHDDDVPLLPLSGGSVSPTPTSTSAFPPADPSSTALPSTSALGNYSNPRDKASTAGPIVGGVGAFLIITLISFLIRLHLRRRRTKWSNPGRIQQTEVIISPFVHTPHSTVHSSGRLQKFAPVTANSLSGLPMTVSNTKSPIVHSIENAYSGYTTPGSSSRQILSASNSAPSNPDESYQGQNRRPLRSMITGNHLSSVEEMTSTSSLQSQNNVETIRSGAEVGVIGEEMSISDMREQLMSMREQITYLQDLQRSPGGQRLSDNPPPGYTPERTPARYLSPPFTTSLSEG